MAQITGVVKSPIQGKTGTLNRSSGYEYRDFWYTNASGQRVHVVGWHRAVDLTTLGTVVAFARGKVVSIQKGITGQTTNPSGGNSVTLLHANGCKSIYCHLDNGSNNHLNVGDIVEEGAKLGTDVIKTTGNSTGLHLHFAIYDPNQTYQSSNYMNPIDYLQGKKKLIGYGGSPEPTPGLKYKVGDKVKFTGTLYGDSYGGHPGQTRKDLTATISIVNSKGTCPYNINNGLGWVKEADLTPIEPEYKTGNYKTLYNMNVRTGAGTNYSVKKVKDLTADGKKNATNTNPDANAVYKTGTIFTALQIINQNGVWAKTPSGYVCIKGTSGTKYCTKL